MDLNKWPSVAILLICEKGYLEKQTILFVRCFLKHCRLSSTTKIIVFSPRKNKKPSNRTIKELRRLGVSFINENLNTEYSYYGFGNKPFVCAFAEENIKVDVFIFADSDLLFLNPFDLTFLQHYNLGISPVEKKGIGTLLEKRDENFQYWKKLFSFYEISIDYGIFTSVTKELIFPYFNAGLIVTKPKNNLFRTWRDIFQKMMKNSLIPDEITFIDQISLSIAIHKLGLFYYLFSLYEHFPLHVAIDDKESSYKFDKLICIHYHNAFAKYSPIHPLDIFEESSEKLSQVKELVKSTGIYPIPGYKHLYRSFRKVFMN